jgi:hypothetical protein
MSRNQVRISSSFTTQRINCAVLDDVQKPGMSAYGRIVLVVRTMLIAQQIRWLLHVVRMTVRCKNLHSITRVKKAAQELRHTCACVVCVCLHVLSGWQGGLGGLAARRRRATAATRR